MDGSGLDLLAVQLHKVYFTEFQPRNAYCCKFMKFLLLQIGYLLILLLGLGSVWADHPEHYDHNTIKRLRDAGEILPLETIIDKFQKTYRRGRILEAELEMEDGRYIYELVILDGKGSVRELEYDAHTGAFWRAEETH
jgi:hypothetical protein